MRKPLPLECWSLKRLHPGGPTPRGLSSLQGIDPSLSQGHSMLGKAGTFGDTLDAGLSKATVTFLSAVVLVPPSPGRHGTLRTQGLCEFQGELGRPGRQGTRGGGSGVKHYLGLGLWASSRPDGSGGGWKIRAPREVPWVSGGWRCCGEPRSLDTEGGLLRGPVRAVLCFGEEGPWAPWFSPQGPLALLVPQKEQRLLQGPSGVLRGSSQPSSARSVSRDAAH